METGKHTSPNYEIAHHLAQNGIMEKWLADNIEVSKQWVNAMLKGCYKIPEKRLVQINTLLNTDFQLPDNSVSDLLPHEQLEATKQQLKDKPLFKDDVGD